MKLAVFTILILCITQFTFAQSTVTINKNKKNTALFDDSSPNSLFGVLKSSYENLGFFDLQGMSDSLVNTLDKVERAKLYKYSSNISIPLYDEFGEPLIVTNEEFGYLEYVYSTPDTVFISLDNIERIVLHIENGDGLKLHRIKNIEFWKKYGGNMHCVISLSADIFSLKGFKYIEAVNKEIQEKWLDRDDPGALWNQMKKASLETRERNKIMDGGDEEKDFFMSFFPTSYDFYFYDFIASTATQMDKDAESINYLQVMNDYKTDHLPFQFSFGDALSADSNERKRIESHFYRTERYWQYSPTPLIEEDPDSYNYMEPLVKQNEDGTLEYVYEDPELFYVWLDYKDIEIYAIKEFVFDGDIDEMVSKIVGLVCTQKTQVGKPEIVSYMPSEGEFKSYFEAFPITKLQELPWHKVLRKEAERKRNVKKNNGFYLSIG